MKVLSYGEILWDVYPEKVLIGGAIFNCAAHLSRLGAKSYLMSSIGDDSLGVQTYAYLEKYGIKTDYITKSSKRSGQCKVSFDENQVPAYDILADTALDDIRADIDKEQSFDAICFGSLAQRGEKNLNKLKGLLDSVAFSEKFCDINIRKPFYSDDVIGFCLENATVMKISREEMPVIKRAVKADESLDHIEFSKYLSNRFKNLKVIIITLAKGFIISTIKQIFDCKEKKEHFKAALKVKTVSSVGAGDSFSAAFLYNYLKNEPIDKCLEEAVKLSAFVVTRVETVPEY
ncbi:MAG: PfkB family carbohydrate kinase [Clostridia bacterium]|nr:PfkB family carbohydrate kinase [Clostridia bacterium]